MCNPSFLQYLLISLIVITASNLTIQFGPKPLFENVSVKFGDGNRYVDEQAPWGLKKTDPQRMETVLYVLAETIRCVALLVQPFMPDSMGKMLDQLSVPQDQRSFDTLNAAGALKAGTPLPTPSGIFPRYVEEVKA